MNNIKWCQEHVSYVDANDFFDNFGKETGISNFREKVEEFMKNPSPEGVVISGTKRTSVKVFIPDLTFDEHIEMGENPWVFMGTFYPVYCIYGM